MKLLIKIVSIHEFCSVLQCSESFHCVGHTRHWCDRLIAVYSYLVLSEWYEPSVAELWLQGLSVFSIVQFNLPSCWVCEVQLSSGTCASLENCWPWIVGLREHRTLLALFLVHSVERVYDLTMSLSAQCLSLLILWATGMAKSNATDCVI